MRKHPFQMKQQDLLRVFCAGLFSYRKHEHHTRRYSKCFHSSFFSSFSLPSSAPVCFPAGGVSSEDGIRGCTVPGCAVPSWAVPSGCMVLSRDGLPWAVPSECTVIPAAPGWAAASDIPVSRIADTMRLCPPCPAAGRYWFFLWIALRSRGCVFHASHFSLSLYIPQSPMVQSA